MPKASLTYGSAADERLGQRPRSTCPLGEHFVVHVDGNYTNTDDLEIGGFVLTPGAARRGGGQPGARRSRHWPSCAAVCPTARPRPPNSPAAIAWIDGEQQCRLLGQPL